MPIKKSAKKALRQAIKRAAENEVFKQGYKKAVKEAKRVANAGQDVADALKLAQKKLDKAAKKGVLSKKTAARKLSRLAKSLAPKKK